MTPLMSLPQGEGQDQFHLVIGASASRMEGWGMSVQDMTAGAYPLVSSEFVPYAVHLHQRDDAVLIVWMGDEEEKGPRAYAEAIRSLIEDPAAARQMAERGRAIACEFGWPKLVDRFVEGVSGFLPATCEEAKTIYPVILAGGVGKRLVPLSSKEKPKQFLRITDRSMSMLQQTWERLSVDPQYVYVATNGDYVQLVRSQLSDVPAENIVGEPVMRNTAPAIATLMYQIAMRDPDAVAAVLPADHWIESSKVFGKRVAEAARVAREADTLVTFGIKPAWSSPDYGYIQRQGDGLAGFTNAFAVSRFVEKPDSETAQRYMEDGNYYWNSGMFVWRAAVFLELLQRYQPVMFAALETIYGREPAPGPIPDASLLKFFKGLHGISIDYALMEPAAADGRVMVLSLDTPWSDVGTWEGLNRLVQDGKVKPPDEVRRILDEKFPRK
jgi:mannose-1-phosphate guanylyltransferase